MTNFPKFTLLTNDHGKFGDENTTQVMTVCDSILGSKLHIPVVFGDYSVELEERDLVVAKIDFIKINQMLK